jgi:hypothetical protein
LGSTETLEELAASVFKIEQKLNLSGGNGLICDVVSFSRNIALMV